LPNDEGSDHTAGCIEHEMTEPCGPHDTEEWVHEISDGITEGKTTIDLSCRHLQQQSPDRPLGFQEV
jgi:hypothetical protein